MGIAEPVHVKTAATSDSASLSEPNANVCSSDTSGSQRTVAVKRSRMTAARAARVELEQEALRTLGEKRSEAKVAQLTSAVVEAAAQDALLAVTMAEALPLSAAEGLGGSVSGPLDAEQQWSAAEKAAAVLAQRQRGPTPRSRSRGRSTGTRAARVALEREALGSLGGTARRDEVAAASNTTVAGATAWVEAIEPHDGAGAEALLQEVQLSSGSHGNGLSRELGTRQPDQELKEARELFGMNGSIRELGTSQSTRELEEAPEVPDDGCVVQEDAVVREDAVVQEDVVGVGTPPVELNAAPHWQQICKLQSANLQALRSELVETKEQLRCSREQRQAVLQQHAEAQADVTVTSLLVR